MTMNEQFAIVMKEMQTDAIRFVCKILKAEPTEQQKILLKEIVKPGAHISVRSGHGTGKTTSLAWIVLWFLCCFPGVKIPCTAPTGHQLFDLLWPEIHKWQGQMLQPWQDGIRITSDKVAIKDLENRQFAVARTARPENPEALQGFHAENLLFLVDEASGVPEKVFEVAEGALSTKDAKVIMTSNPTRTEGYFYRSHFKDRHLWKTLHFNCLDSPLVDEAYPNQMAEKYGEDSNIYRVRVLGEFPVSSDDILIPLDQIMDSVDRDVQFPQSPRIAGLDVARFGDDTTALLIRQGGKVLSVEEWRNKDLMQTTGRVAEAFAKNEFDRVMVDSIGLGAGVVDRLVEMGVPAVGINVAESSPQKEQFNRLRDQLWWACREFFTEQKSCLEPKIPLLENLIGELSSVRYGYTSTGKIKIEGKDDMKKRGMQSPNLADALCLTFAEGVSPKARIIRPFTVKKQASDGWT